MLRFAPFAAVFLLLAAYAGSASSPSAPASAGGGALVWGDWRCSGALDATDVLAVLVNVVGLSPLSQTEPCPNIGETVDIAGGSPHVWGDSLCDGSPGATDALDGLRGIALIDPLQRPAGCPRPGDPFTLIEGTPTPTASPTVTVTTGDIKVVSFDPAQPGPYVFPAGVLDVTPLTYGETKHNNGPDVVGAGVYWLVEKTLGASFVGFRWSAQAGDICTLADEPVPCAEGDAPGDPSSGGDNCFDGIDNDNDGKADLFGTGPTDPDPDLPADPECTTFIDKLYFEIDLPVSAAVQLERDLSVQCNTAGEIEFRARNVEEPLFPAEDPEPGNNNLDVTIAAECQ